MKNENNSLPKVSVIIPVYNTSRFLERCIESVIEQSFTEIEIICVDDGSSDMSPEILKRYAARDGRIKIVTHEKNMGLFAARITGVRESKGEYLCFVDSDDYISFDYLRALVTRAMRGDCDLVMASTVHTDGTGAKWMHSQSARMKIEDRFGTDVLAGLLCQEGYCFLWHAVWNKLYKRRLFDLGLEFLSGVGEHIIMGEDILLSIVLHYYAESFSYTEYAHYFYFQHEGASTSSLSDAKRAQKYITDISTVFSLAEGFLRKKGVGDEALSHFEKWRKLYSRFWCDNIRNSAISPREKARLLGLLAESFSLDDIQPTRIGDGWFYSQSVPFDTRYLDLLSKIRGYDTVSFDLFDTLLTRPVLRPDDLFYFLDERYGKILGGSFHDIRCLAERRLRERTKGEVTLDGIYEEIKESLSLDAATLEEIKRAEIELEDEYLTVRKSVKNLLDFAHSLGKEIIITSDFYMGGSIISPILKKRGIYFDKLIISSDFGKTKAEGGLFSILLSKASSGKILHIGDSWHSDIEKCNQYGVDAHFYPSVSAAFMNEIPDIKSSPSTNAYTEPWGQIISFEHGLKFFEVRCALALSAARIFDNPYLSYIEGSLFNCSADFIGYYALGMHLFSVAKWLFEDNAERSGRLHFIARDGYLPKLAYDILNGDGKGAPSDYIHSSRKALLPLIFGERCAPEELLPLVRGATERGLCSWLSAVLEDGALDGDLNNKKRLSDNEIYDFIKNYLQKRLSKEKYAEYLSAVRAYFSSRVSEGDAFFDIGYSGRPIMLVSELLGMRFDGYFIHRVSDAYMARQRRLGLKIKSFYDFTPSITGSIREMLFSATAPSSIGYKTVGDVAEPIFEQSCADCSAAFAIGELQRQALDFVSDMNRLYKAAPELFSARGADMSAPFEMLLSCKSEPDAEYFGAVGFEDELYLGGRELPLSAVWRASQDYHRVRPVWERERGGSLLDKSLSEFLSGASVLKRALVFLLLDRKAFKHKLKKRFRLNKTL